MQTQTLPANTIQIEQEFLSDPANTFIRLNPQQCLDPVHTADSSIANEYTALCVIFLSQEPLQILLQSQSDLVSKSALATKPAFELAAYQPLVLQHLGVLLTQIEETRLADCCLVPSVNFIATFILQILLLAQLCELAKYFLAAFACPLLPISFRLISTTVRTTSAVPGICGND